MNVLPGVTRRTLVATALAGGAGFWAPVLTHAGLVRQVDLANWNITDGLRLAGSVSGLASLDPVRSRDLPSNFLLRQVHRGLMALDASLKPVPELAETVAVSDDGREYTFTIRPGARFHDGRLVTPDDVRLSLSRALDPRVVDGDAAALAGVAYLREIQGAADQIAGRTEFLGGVSVTGSRTLDIALDAPSPTFAMKLASVPASIVDTRAVPAGSALPDLPNASGPFSVAGWVPDQSLDLVASGSWWRGTPALPRVQFRLGIGASQPVNLFQAGEIDLIEDVTPALVDLVADPASAAPVGELLETQLFATSYIALGNAVPPLDDVHVRRALHVVLPSRLVAEATFDGTVVTANGLLPPGLLDAPWPVARLSGSVDSARAALSQSRYGSAANVPPISIYAADIAPVETLRDVAASELGLTVEAVQVGWSDFLDGLANRRFPAYAIYWGADYPDPESLVDALFGARSPENYTGYANSELESMLLEARSATGARRVAIYERANQLLIDDAALIPLYHPIGYTVARPGIGGLAVTPMGLLGLETIHQR